MVMKKNIINCSKPTNEWKNPSDQKTIVDMTSDEVAKHNSMIEESKLLLIEEMRANRDRLLTETDYTQMSDAPLQVAKKTEWAAYRQALRDIPQIHPDGNNVMYPVKPI